MTTRTCGRCTRVMTEPCSIRSGLICWPCVFEIDCNDKEWAWFGRMQQRTTIHPKAMIARILTQQLKERALRARARRHITVFIPQQQPPIPPREASPSADVLFTVFGGINDDEKGGSI